LAAISVALECGFSYDKIASALRNFQGVARRMQKVYDNEEFVVIDDYAHHPTEVKSTLLGFNERYGKVKRIGFFEPHRYSRTELCFDRFSKCFSGLDELYLMPIYPAGEDPIPGVTSELLLEEIKKNSSIKKIEMIKSEQILQKIKEFKSLNTPCAVLAMGAGSIGKNFRKAVESI